MPSLDDAPVWVRLTPGMLGLGILAWKTGLIEPPSIEPPLILAGVLAAAGAALTVGMARHRGRGRRDREEGSGCYGYRLRLEDPGESARLARIIEERAQRGYADYIVMSSFSQAGHGNLLLLCGQGAPLVREKEIFETLVETVLERVRIERVPGVPRDLIQAARLAVRGRDRRGEPSLVSWVSGAREAGSGLSEPLVVLGRRVDKPLPRPVSLVEEDLEGHVGVYGSTGTGKSTTLAKIARQVASKWDAVVVFDWTGEYSRLGGRVLDPASGGVPFNPFSLVEEPGGVHGLVDILSGSLGLSDPQAYMLQRILEEEKPDSIESLLASVWRWPEESKWDREVKKGLARRLGVLRGALRATQGGSAPAFRGLVVVDVSRIEGVRARRAYTLLLASSIYYSRRRGAGGRVLLVFDESHNVFMDGVGVFGEMMAESRKYGVHIAYATQAPSLVPDNILVNTNTKIVHALRSQRDKAAIAQAMSLSEDLVYLLDKLARGEAIVQAPSIPEPVLVKIDP